MASPAKVAYHEKQLRKLFARANNADFLQLVWAVDALQSDRIEAASKFLTFPPAAADSSPASPFAIHRWELETLLIQLLLTPKQPIRPGPNLILNCRVFDSMREAINRLRNLENVESALYLKGDRFHILDEMHRIAQRQFHWQSGYFNLPQFYRYAFVYGQGACAEFFEQEHGLKVSDLSFVGFVYFATSRSRPGLGRAPLPDLGLTQDMIDRALPLLATTHDQARLATTKMIDDVSNKHGRPIPTAYLPSVLRRFPLLAHETVENLYVAPIPEIILIRVTSGLYYDLIAGGQDLLNEANDRFEQYCANYISTMMPRFLVSRSFQYGKKGSQIGSPDLIVQDGGKVVVVAECKATKLSYLAQFAEDPFDAERKQYQQIARGVFQLWRYFSHVRRGMLESEHAPETHAMVLTLDPFGMMSDRLRSEIFDEAKRLADDEDDISEEDRRHVIICPVQELELALHTSNENIFLASLKAAQAKKYIGWQFREIHRDAEGAKGFGSPRKFPFDLGSVLPWWSNTQEKLEQNRAATAPAEAG